MANLKKKETVTPEYGDTFTKELPCGYEDETGVVHTEFEYREMDGSDEEAISKNTVKNNGAKIINTVLSRCILRIGTISKADVKPAKWDEIIKSLNVPDQDFAVMEIRRLSVGDTISVKHVCSSCKKELTTEIDIDEFELVPFQGERVLEFELKRGYKDKDGELHKTGTIRFPNGADREVLEPVAKNNLGLANTLMLSRLVMSLGSLKSVTDPIIRSLTSGDREYLLGVIQENLYGYKFETDIDCPNCGNSFRGSLSAVNFM